MALEVDGLQYHIRLKKGDVGRYVLLPGDPFRTDLIATYFEHPQLMAHNREHKTWTGYIDGVKVSVTSTGMGCPSTAICQSKDSFYGEVDPDSSPVAKRLKERWEAWKRGNVLASEMEAAALFVISSIRGCRAGAIVSFKDVRDSIRVACDAIRILARKDGLIQ